MGRLVKLRKTERERETVYIERRKASNSKWADVIGPSLSGGVQLSGKTQHSHCEQNGDILKMKNVTAANRE